MKNFLEEYEDVAYKVLNYIGAEINYGVRVTDHKDQRLIKTILESYMCPDVLNFDAHKLSKSGIYYVSASADKDQYLKYIESLPYITGLEVFG